MVDSSTMPCIPLPNPKPLKITLPFGGELKAPIDPSKGLPTDCTLVHSLMLQLAPTLAGMECFFKILNVIRAIQELSKPGNPVSKLKAIGNAAAKAVGCFVVFANIPIMIVDILRLIIAYLRCIIQAIESIVDFQVGIDLNSAEGNPVLLASLSCAQNNAQIALGQQIQALAVVESVLSMIKPISDLAEPKLSLPDLSKLKLSGKTPSLADATGLQEVSQTLQDLNITLEKLQETLDAIPV
jgi:hypothetical protein